MRPFLFDFGEMQLGPLVFPLRVPSYGAAMMLAIIVGWFVVRRLGARVAPHVPWFGLLALLRLFTYRRRADPS